MNVNALQQYLKLYDSLNLNPNYAGISNASIFAVADANKRADWAMEKLREDEQRGANPTTPYLGAMGKNKPDFFSGQPGGQMQGGGPGEERKYVQPQQFVGMPQPQPIQNGLIPQGASGQPLWQEMQDRARQQYGEERVRPDVLNYLKKLLGGGQYGR